MKKINGRWIDENNNAWNGALSEEEANLLSASMINCHDCNDCSDCFDCEYCNACVYCRHCECCINCISCDYCDYCQDCTDCLYCTHQDGCHNGNNLCENKR